MQLHATQSIISEQKHYEFKRNEIYFKICDKIEQWATRMTIFGAEVANRKCGLKFQRTSDAIGEIWLAQRSAWICVACVTKLC